MTVTDHQAIFAKEIKANRVFILGAGFSAAAGVPLTNELLHRALALFANECPGIYSRVEGYALQSIAQEGELNLSQINFSDLCTFLEFVELREYGGGERWSENGSREKLALRFYLAKALIASTPTEGDIPHLYLEFASQLQPRDIIVSFNWDGLLEAALAAIGKEYTYDGSNDKAIRISKLHGSVNWRLGEPRRLDSRPPALPWTQLDFGSGMMDRHLYCAADLLYRNTWSYFSPLSEVDPFLVLPGYGKAFDVRANAPLWYKPEFLFALTHDVYIIGLSLAHDDFLVKSFFLANLPYIHSFTGVEGRKIFIINPSSAVYSDYEFVLRTGHAEVWNEPFSIEHVRKIVRSTVA